MTRAQILASIEFNKETLAEAQSILGRIQKETTHTMSYYPERLASAQKLVNDIKNHSKKLQAELSRLDEAEKQKQNCHGFTKTGHAFATTLGWDGKDYEGLGKTWPCWESPRHPGKIFIRIYVARYKEWCFLEITSRNSSKGAPVAEFAYSFPKYE